VASVANPLLPAKGIVQIGKEYACQRLSKIGGNLIAVLCQHSLHWQKGCLMIVGKLFASFCQIVQD